MATQAALVPAGKLFCISRGEYSDYGYQGHFLALVEITHEMFQEVIDECKATQRRENSATSWASGEDWGADEKFLPALVRRGWVVDIDCIEIHTGSYGQLEIS